jgi:hypothetical protein
MAQPVKPPDNQHVAGGAHFQRAGKAGALARGAGNPVLEDFGAFGGLAEGQDTGRRSRREHSRTASRFLRLTFATCKPLISLASVLVAKTLVIATPTVFQATRRKRVSRTRKGTAHHLEADRK